MMSRGNVILIFVVWAIVTAFNLTKAFHIDDTYYLLAAEWIQSNPMRPMSGEINWQDSSVPIHVENNPPLFLYLMAGWASVFGFSEISMHLLTAVFTLLAIFFFIRIQGETNVKKNIIYLALFALSPAFIVNQNVMLDMPLTALLLAFFWAISQVFNGKGDFYYLVAACILSAALLIKYTVLPLVAVFVCVLLFRRAYRWFGVALIPPIVLGLWSGWNYLEYGGVHLLDRPRNEFNWMAFIAFPSSFGAVCPALLVVMAGLSGEKIYGRILNPFLQFAVWAGLLLPVFIGFGVISRLISEPDASLILSYLFIANGWVGILVLGVEFIFWLRNHSLVLNIASLSLLMALSLICFQIIYAPFSATRHAMLIVPLFLISMSQYYFKAPVVLRSVGLLLTIAGGVLLGISDRVYADYYKQSAGRIHVSDSVQTNWFVGHWGWQWYARQAGLKEYSLDSSRLKLGDRIFLQSGVAQQILTDRRVYELETTEWSESEWRTFVSVHHSASMYSSSIVQPPWTFSRTPIDTMQVYTVGDFISLDSLIIKIRKNPEWMSNLRGVSERTGEALDTLILKNAIYFLEETRNEEH